MKRHITLLLCMVILVALALVGCEAHQHTYGDEWQMSETNHWHNATCTDGAECPTAKAAYETHEDTDNNKVCDVCGYDYGHTHTYAEDTYSSDATTHWIAATCGCNVVKDKVAHTDKNDDGECDICKYNGGHEHTFDEESWATDGETHWHPADCGHSVKGSEEEHEFDSVGLCSVCGYIEGETVTVEKAVDMGAFYDTNVKSGTILYKYGTETLYTTAASYEFGKNGSMMINEFNSQFYINAVTYYTPAANGVFAVREDVVDELGTLGEPYKYEPLSANAVNGFCFADVISTAYGSTTYEFYGVKALIQGLYELAKASEEMVELQITSSDGTTMYSFSYKTDIIGGEKNEETGLINGGKQFDITVVFSLSDSYTFENVAVSYEGYNVEPASIGENLYVYAPISLYPTEVYEYTIAQEAGERDYVSKYTPENLCMTDFVLTDGTNEYKNGDTIKVIVGSYLSYDILPKAPEGITADFDSVTIKTSSDKFNMYVSYYGKINLWTFNAPGEPGKYELTITTVNASATFIFEVGYPEVTEINPTVNGSETTDKTVYLNGEGIASAVIGVTVNNKADDSFTAAITSGEGATLSLNDAGDYTFKATAAGTWQITVTSVSKPEITAVLTITVSEPQAASGIDGTYEYSETFWDGTTITATLTFANGTLTVADGDYWYHNFDGQYTYTYDGTTLAVDNAGKDFTVALNSDGTVSFMADASMPWASQFVFEKNEPSIDGTYEYSETFWDGTTITATLTFDNGTLTVADGDYWYHNFDGQYTYTYDGTTLTVDNAGKDFTVALNSDGTVSFIADASMPWASETVFEVALPTLDEGKYEATMPMWGLNYTITVEGTTVTIEDVNATFNGVYSYVYEGGKFNIYDGDEFIGLGIYYDGNLGCYMLSTGYLDLEMIYVEPTLPEGTYVAAFKDWYSGQTITYTLTVNGTTLDFVDSTEFMNGTYTLVYNNGIFELYDAEGYNTYMSIFEDENLGCYMFSTGGWQSYELAYEGGEGGGEGGDEPTPPAIDELDGTYNVYEETDSEDAEANILYTLVFADNTLTITDSVSGKLTGVYSYTVDGAYVTVELNGLPSGIRIYKNEETGLWVFSVPGGHSLSMTKLETETPGEGGEDGDTTNPGGGNDNADVDFKAVFESAWSWNQDGGYEGASMWYDSYEDSYAFSEDPYSDAVSVDITFDGLNMTIDFPVSYFGKFYGATFTYDVDGDCIVAELLNGSTVYFEAPMF